MLKKKIKGFVHHSCNKIHRYPPSPRALPPHEDKDKDKGKDKDKDKDKGKDKDKDKGKDKDKDPPSPRALPPHEGLWLGSGERQGRQHLQHLANLVL